MDDDRLKRHDLTDAEWARLEPLLPAHPRQGHRWNDHRVVIDGIFCRVRTGCPWRDLPEGLGRPRGGLSTKVHLLADARCRPLARVTSAGQRHDSLAFLPLMGRLRIARPGRGRPRTRPGRVLADKAYSSTAIRAHLRRR